MEGEIDPAVLSQIMRRLALKRERADRPCAVCGATMPNALKRQRYCSYKCAKRAYRQRRQGSEQDG